MEQELHIMSSFMLNENEHYRISLLDYSAPAFTSFGKPYFGTLLEIRTFLSALEAFAGESSGHSSLLDAFRAFNEGKTDVTYKVTYQEVPLLIPAKLHHVEKIESKNYVWNHLNTWESTYKLRCEKVISVHSWFECKDRFFRTVKAHFTDLQCKGSNGRWKPVKGPFWGFPCIMTGAPPNLYNALEEIEKRLNSENELHQDWETFKAKPDPNYAEICNDIFGDG